MSAFQPAPFQIVDQPEQLRAFTDPLRSRLLWRLCEEEATNQQLAEALGEPQAKVLHHVRTLLDMGLIRLVDTRIKGGNVEKYYRAVARMFGLRSPGEQLPAIAAAEIEALREEVRASALLFPDQQLLWEGRHTRLSPERAQEFYRRLVDLVGEYWGGPHIPSHQDPDAPTLAFFAVMYREPSPPAPDPPA